MDVPAILRDLVAWVQWLPQIGGAIITLAGVVIVADKTWPALKRFWQGGTEVVGEHVIDPRIEASLAPLRQEIAAFRGEVMERFNSGSINFAQILTRQDTANGGLKRLTDDVVDLREFQRHQVKYMTCLPEWKEPEES